MLSGLINLDKPNGPTSHDMVALVRRRLGLKQVGHAGTLDPMATGVLVIGVGQATRLMNYVGDGSKEYIARLLLGRSTDSQDITGTVLSEASAAEITEAALRDACRRFTGPILQTPPMVSAVKHQGKRLYQLAREGKTVERQARPVNIFELEVQEFQAGEKAEATLKVRCSGGTYIRTICADIGETLGVGGCMAALRRTEVGPFLVVDAVTVDKLAEQGANILLPPVAAVRHLPAVVLDAAQESRVRHGNVVETESASSTGRAGSINEVGTREGIIVRLESGSGELVALARETSLTEGRAGYQPFLVMAL